MTTVEQPITIEPLATVPERLSGVRQELNQLWYGPSEVLVARRASATGAGDTAGDEVVGDEVVGAVRLAMRERPARPHGLIADLIVDDALRESGLPERLIA